MTPKYTLKFDDWTVKVFAVMTLLVVAVSTYGIALINRQEI